jgi:nicotinate-nucleotide--dimethylbenzimidazole phosphoribosyltransferase
MVENFLAGGAAVSVFSRLNGIALTVVDCGVKHDFLAGLPAGSQRPGLQVRKAVGAEQGTADSSVQAAMTAEQCQQAMAHGVALVKELPGNALLLGEMGIGNTSAASLLLSRLAGLDIEVCTGAGTGLDAPAVQRKTAVLREVLSRHPNAKSPLDVLAALGGFEIATMVGAVLQAAHERRVVVVDGFIATSAVLVAHAMQPLVLQRCVFAHRSGERGKPCWIWACVWEKVLVQPWPGRCCSPPAPCCVRWPALRRPGYQRSRRRSRLWGLERTPGALAPGCLQGGFCL